MPRRKEIELAIEDAINAAETAGESPHQWIFDTLDDRGFINHGKPVERQTDPLTTKYSTKQKTTLASLRVGKHDGLSPKTLNSLEKLGLVDLKYFPSLTARGVAVASYLEHTTR